MTQNRRIFLNIVATYGRSLYALVLGLFTARWALMALGQVDYGLMGLVGGLIAFVTFLNGLMAGAVSRFYAFAVGETQRTGNYENGLENCRRWFNVAIFIHALLPTVLVAVGYPCGIWAIEHYLAIPPDRIDACVWVWRFSCVSAWIGMVNVPFSAMYQAKQEIAELTIYGFATTTLNACFLYYMITHPGFWLVKFSAWSCILGALPQGLICMMALVHYRECRFRFRYLWDVSRMKDLSIYAGGRFICAFSYMVRSNVVAVLINKCLGPAKNATMSIGTAVSVHAMTLSSALVGAFAPAITNAAGANDGDRMRALTFSMCKYGTVSILIFAIPLIIEIDNVMQIWLSTPPRGVAPLCACLLFDAAISKLVDGHWMAIFAMGKTFAFNVAESVGCYVSFFLIWSLILLGLDVVSVGLGIVVCSVYTIGIKLYWGRRICGLSIRYWLWHIMLPVLFVVVVAAAVACVPRILMAESFLRVLLTVLVSESVFLPLTWRYVLEAPERRFLADKFVMWCRYGRKRSY